MSIHWGFARTGDKFSPADQIDSAGDGWWHDFSDPSTTFQESGATTPATVGDSLGYAADKSGNGYHATQSNGSNLATLAAIGGRTGAKFNGTTSHLRSDAISTAILTGSDTPVTIHFAYYLTATTANQTILAGGRSSSNSPQFFTGINASSLGTVTRRDDSTTSVTPTYTPRTGEWRVASLRFNGTTVDLWLDGLIVLDGVAMDVGTLTLDRFAYGALIRTSVLNYFSGYIGECFGVAGAQTYADVSAAHRYLLGKWRNQFAQYTDFFAIMGQSNAEGRGTSAQSPSVTYGDAFLINSSSKFIPLADPVGGADTGSAWPAFANEWKSRTGRPTFWVEQATGGTGLQPATGTPNWDVTTGTLYPAAVSAIQTAEALIAKCPGYFLGRFAALWAQGENDAVELNGTTVTQAGYETHLTELIDDMKSTFTLWKFLIFELGVDGDGLLDDEFDAIRAGQDNVAAAETDVEIIFDRAKYFLAEGKMVDNRHYTQEGYNEMGTVGASHAADLI